jgi:hypothetical protein
MISLSRNKVNMTMMLLEQTFIKSTQDTVNLQFQIPRLGSLKESRRLAEVDSPCVGQWTQQVDVSFFEQFFDGLKSIDDDLLVHLLPHETKGFCTKKEIYSYATAALFDEVSETHRKILWTKSSKSRVERCEEEGKVLSQWEEG